MTSPARCRSSRADDGAASRGRGESESAFPSRAGRAPTPPSRPALSGLLRQPPMPGGRGKAAVQLPFSGNPALFFSLTKLYRNVARARSGIPKEDCSRIFGLYKREQLVAALWARMEVAHWRANHYSGLRRNRGQAGLRLAPVLGLADRAIHQSHSKQFAAGTVEALRSQLTNERDSKQPPWRHTAQMIRANLLARATVARGVPRRVFNSSPQARRRSG